MSLTLKTSFLVALNAAQRFDLGVDRCLLGLVALGDGLPFPLLQQMVFVDESLGRAS